MEELQRTHTCGELTAANQGLEVVLMGWVNRWRDHGQLLFVDLRDRDGMTQLVFNAENNADLHRLAKTLRSEFVIAARGQVRVRGKGLENPNLKTGEIEVVAGQLWVLSDAKTTPFPIEDEITTSEELRLKYRYLDLRRPKMQENFRMRHRITMTIRDYMDGQGFWEVETPILTKSTPEGARDYLVPSRLQHGSFYALPQSPQLFKQILMISGFEKYFQIVRCFRDEDLRADRQPEFTQIDIEMSYPQTESVWAVVEGFLTAAFKAAGHEIKAPFPRMSYDEAIRRYGNDKPDMRLPAMVDVREAISPQELDDFAAKFKIRKEFPVQ